MSDPVADRLGALPSRSTPAYGQGSSANLADILERVLDKGIVIAGDIQINLLDIELLTIKLRLLIASVDKAREMGIDWWEHDPALSSRADGRPSLAEENRRLRAEVDALRRGSELAPGGGGRTDVPTGAGVDDGVRPRVGGADRDGPDEPHEPAEAPRPAAAASRSRATRRREP